MTHRHTIAVWTLRCLSFTIFNVEPSEASAHRHLHVQFCVQTQHSRWNQSPRARCDMFLAYMRAPLLQAGNHAAGFNYIMLCALFTSASTVNAHERGSPEGNFYAFRTPTSSTAPPPTPPLPTEEEGGVLVRRELLDVGPRSRTSVCVFCTRTRSQHSSRVAEKKRS